MLKMEEAIYPWLAPHLDREAASLKLKQQIGH